MSDSAPSIPDPIEPDHSEQYTSSWWTSTTEWFVQYQFVVGAALGLVVGGVTTSLIRYRK